VRGVLERVTVDALNGVARPEIKQQFESYRRRRDILVSGLRETGWSVSVPKATFYVWARCPKGLDSMVTASRILAEANVVVIPGVGFGRCGEGYVRFALTVDEPRTAEAVGRVARITW